VASVPGKSPGRASSSARPGFVFPQGKPRLSAHRHADGFTPLSHAGIADAVNGPVGPFHRRGRERLAIDVAGWISEKGPVLESRQIACYGLGNSARACPGMNRVRLPAW
jgi:hypothetical protein